MSTVPADKLEGELNGVVSPKSQDGHAAYVTEAVHRCARQAFPKPKSTPKRPWISPCSWDLICQRRAALKDARRFLRRAAYASGDAVHDLVAAPLIEQRGAAINAVRDLVELCKHYSAQINPRRSPRLAAA